MVGNQMAFVGAVLITYELYYSHAHY